MHAVTIICIALTVGEVGELAGLPPRDVAVANWLAASRFVTDLERRQQNIGGWYAERLGEVLHDARLLRDCWGYMADASLPFCDNPAWQIERARLARLIFDYRYGWPPVLPYWYLPTSAP
jgi:hypothetical protein